MDNLLQIKAAGLPVLHNSIGIRKAITKVLLASTILMTSSTVLKGQPFAKECGVWLERISSGSSPSDKLNGKKDDQLASTDRQHDPWGVKSLSEGERLGAINCLLSAEDNTRISVFEMRGNSEWSQMYSAPPVNLAALWVISYIYTNDFNHSLAMALVGQDAASSDSNGIYVTKQEAIHRAYRAYRVWFKKVKTIGLSKAQADNLDPLEGTGLCWYGTKYPSPQTARPSLELLMK
jgi:hypothetical protein